MMAAMRTQGMLLRRGLVLEYATLAWNVSAPRSSSSLRLPRSVAPADVGVDALIEIVASAAVVVWQLQEIGARVRERGALRRRARCRPYWPCWARWQSKAR
jgi:hypothetical protein